MTTPGTKVPSSKEVLVDSVARALNAAGIPCVLWGHFLWAVYCIPTVVFWHDLVIPDASLEAATRILTTGRFSKPFVACPDPTTCGDGSSPERRHPHPAFHMHVEGMVSIALHLQSETLRFLPPFDPSLANPRGCQLPRYLALACDETAVPPHQDKLAMGAFELDQTVVLIPKAHILTEALMRIAARDLGKRIGNYAMAHFVYIPQYVEPFGYLDLSLLPEPFEKLYKDRRKVTPLEHRVRLLRTCGVPLWDPELYR